MDAATWNSLEPGDQVQHYLTGDTVWTVGERWTREHWRFVTKSRGPQVPAPGTLVSNESRNFSLIRRAKETP